MRPSDSLRRRIVVIFVSFGIVLSVFFALIATVAVEGIEMHLVDNRLNEVAKWALPRQAAGLAVDLPSGCASTAAMPSRARCAACRKA
jgi:ABC-type lipoprotein release transport system permease subunit